MKSPPGDAGKEVDLALGKAEVLEWNIPRTGKDQLTFLVRSVQNGYYLIR